LQRLVGHELTCVRGGRTVFENLSFSVAAGQALARLFVTRRPIWLLDEPTSALDVRTQAALLAEMKRHLGTGGVIVVATHADLDLEPLARLEIGA
jgi:heme exporter protein A